jgi:hypothetical protein
MHMWCYIIYSIVNNCVIECVVVYYVIIQINTCKKYKFQNNKGEIMDQIWWIKTLIFTIGDAFYYENHHRMQM